MLTTREIVAEYHKKKFMEYVESLDPPYAILPSKVASFFPRSVIGSLEYGRFMKELGFTKRGGPDAIWRKEYGGQDPHDILNELSEFLANRDVVTAAELNSLASRIGTHRFGAAMAMLGYRRRKSHIWRKAA